MTLKDLSALKLKLEELRGSILGDLKKTRDTSKEEEFAEFISDISDEASRATTRQMILNLGEQDRDQLKQVEEALRKIQEGDYGTCEMCEEQIPEARLHIVPHAKNCVACLSELEKDKTLDQENRNNGSFD